MLAAVLSNRSAAADSSGEEQGWRRVIRVPVTCVPGAHAPRLHPQGSVGPGHGQGARSPSQPLASPRVADAPAELLNSFSHASLGSTHGRCHCSIVTAAGLADGMACSRLDSQHFLQQRRLCISVSLHLQHHLHPRRQPPDKQQLLVPVLQPWPWPSRPQEQPQRLDHTLTEFAHLRISVRCVMSLKACCVATRNVAMLTGTCQAFDPCSVARTGVIDMIVITSVLHPPVAVTPALCSPVRGIAPCPPAGQVDAGPHHGVPLIPQLLRGQSLPQLAINKWTVV